MFLGGVRQAANLSYTVMEIQGPSPSRRIPIYFLAAIAVGAVLLTLPISAENGRLSVVDAIFTATSAICVTGLTVVDTGHDLSRFGQVIVLLLIQAGGLGFMTLTTIVLLSLGARITFRKRVSVSQDLDTGVTADLVGLIKAVASTTLLFELFGAFFLLIKFHGRFGLGEACFQAIFHSVSAFCNAGFSTFSDSLESYRFDAPMILIFSGLIISGGLGFAVIRDVYDRFRSGRRGLTLHSKLSLSITAILLVLGTVAFVIAEEGNVFRDTGFGYDLANAFFQSVTSRTAGFNTISQSNLNEISILITLVLMFIGACPGSTGGGIKTTTVGLIVILAVRRFLGRQSVAVFRRTVSNDSVYRALAVLILGIAVVVTMFIIFMYAEQTPLSHRLSHGWFVENLFEVVSAFGTVGLSMGVTSHLHDLGKILLMITMFIGRVGLLTLAFALARPRAQGEIIYREENIMVG